MHGNIFIKNYMKKIIGFFILGVTASSFTYPNNLLMQKGISVVNKPLEEKEFFD